MLNHQQYNFSSKHLCTRPRTEPSTRSGTPLNPKQNQGAEIDLEAMAHSKRVSRLEQQLRDALFARTTAHVGEERILKNAFTKFDKDASGACDFDEFALALEHLGLHVEGAGLAGMGGLPRATVEGLFNRYDDDGSGSLDYNEFCVAMLKDDSEHKML